MGTRADLKALEKKLTPAHTGNGIPESPTRRPSTVTTTVSRFPHSTGGRGRGEFCWRVFWGFNHNRSNEGFYSLKSLSGGLRAGRGGGRVPPSNYGITYWHSPYN